MRRFIAISTLCICCLATVGCGKDVVKQPTYQVLSGETMGTTYSINVPGVESAEVASVLESLIDQRLEQLNAVLSTWRDDSELSRVNRAVAGETLALHEETVKVLVEADRIHKLSDGAFDITVGPLIQLWGFHNPKRIPVPPDENAIKEAQTIIGMAKLGFSAEMGELIKQEDGVTVDVSALAKGYGVDVIAELLKEQGYENYMVEIGGEVQTLGVNFHGESWRIGVERPIPGFRLIQKVVPLPASSGTAMATSGDYRNFFEHDGKRYSHTLDPRTGKPVTHLLRSVSVIHESCMTADALATAVMVLGPVDGYNLLVEQGIAALLIVEEDGKLVERATPGFPVLPTSEKNNAEGA
ncbi:FAD:protein FMN transferase [Calycomorphotria hydatis]|uniref:FAD:protein FMN transferase n=1 Tax=Calycomorphotria hydatis TaxID=2528027 RepID=A0A517TEP0_9PLAN|nr:FAD:protein FMN transferase [Calycomorphotria hydatis]QDT66838.1 Thiamine biosynthesis lipoprotein ApbE precursor [Calycomorphotria hydatis]